MPKRIDDNHKEIVTGLRRVGAKVQSLAGVGMGCPDVLVAYRGHWYVAEIKDGTKFRSQQKLTPAEIKWHNSAPAIVYIWTNLTDALKSIGVLTDK